MKKQGYLTRRNEKENEFKPGIRGMKKKYSELDVGEDRCSYYMYHSGTVTLNYVHPTFIDKVINYPCLTIVFDWLNTH